MGLPVPSRSSTSKFGKVLLMLIASGGILSFSVAGFASLLEKDAQENWTAFVVIDDASTAHIGEMPVDRSVIAEAIVSLNEAGAKAVALKFFYDINKSSDGKLAESMKQLPVLLQYSLAPEGIDQVPAGRDDLRLAANELVEGRAAMVPNSTLRSHMSDMGFVNEHRDGRADAVVMVGKSSSSPAASLQLEILEKVAASRAAVIDGQLKINGHSYGLDDKGRVRCDFLQQGKPYSIPIMDVLNHKLDKDAVKGKVVIIGYSRKDSPDIRISFFRTMQIHEYFYRQVMCVANMIQ